MAAVLMTAPNRKQPTTRPEWRNRLCYGHAVMLHTNERNGNVTLEKDLTDMVLGARKRKLKHYILYDSMERKKTNGQTELC